MAPDDVASVDRGELITARIARQRECGPLAFPLEWEELGRSIGYMTLSFIKSAGDQSATEGLLHH